MADVLSVGVNLEAFAQAISAIQALRSSVSRVFDCLKDGMRNKETLEGREKAFIAHFQDNLHSVNRDLNELERLSNLVGKPSENHPLHNSGLLSLDPVQDKTPLYSQLLQAYKWSNKLQYHAGLASGLLNQQSLKRSANQMGVSAKRRPKAQPTTLVLPPQYVDDVISRIDRMFPEMTIHLSRPNGTSAMLLIVYVLRSSKPSGRNINPAPRMLDRDQRVNEDKNESVCSEIGGTDSIPGQGTKIPHAAQRGLNRKEEKIRMTRISRQVTLGKVLKVIVVMRSLFIDRTIVKGYNENVYTEDGKLDIWSKSNYQVFQKVTDHATTALLHYQLPQMPDVVVRSFMTWLRSYIKLFQAPCQRCGKFLQDGLPPTWRDFRTLEAFHDTCRQ
uniref:Mediator of RNA polymerase II transcription subunit 27 n=1 Tax=Capra hircus TaxID=9925 RepID=A0A8C2P297_CAPHI